MAPRLEYVDPAHRAAGSATPTPRYLPRVREGSYRPCHEDATRFVVVVGSTRFTAPDAWRIPQGP
jgi:hypothetical protein